jgi:PAS domain S-box-containing protein
MEKRENRKNPEKRERHQKESETLLNDVGEMAHVGGWELDVKTKAVHWTKETYRIHDISEDEKFDLSKAVLFFDLPDRSTLEAALQRCMETGEPFDLELPFTSAKGRHLWTRAMGRAVNVGGKVVKLMGTFQDITEHKRAELELVYTQQRLKEAHHLANIGTWDWVMENDTVTWSEELYNIAGRDPSLPAPTYAEHPRVYTPASWDRLSVAVTRALTTGAPYNLELELVRPDSSIRWVSAFGGVKRDRNGKVIGLHGTVQDITERKRAEDKLLFTRHSVDSAIDTMVTVAQDGHFVDVNDSFCRKSGYSRDELLSMTVHDLDPDYNMEIWPAFWNKLKQSGSLIFETTHRTKEGRIYPVEITARYFEYNGNEYHCAFARDITDRKRAEEVLRESEAKYRTVFENTGTAMVVVEESTIISLANEKFAQLTGFSKDDIEGKKSWTEFVVKEDLERMLTQHRLRRQNQEKAIKNYEFRVVTQSGDIHTIDLSIDVIPGTKMSVASLLDITDRKRAEEVLRESEERYRTLAEASPDQIFIVGRDDTMKYANTAVLKLFRLPYDQVVGTPRKNLFPPDVADAQGILIKKIFETGEHVQTEERIQFGTQEFWIDTNLVPLKDKTGNVIAILGIARDITERKRIEEALRENELRYRSLFEGAAEGILVADINTKKFLHANPTMFRMLGYSEGELTTLGVEDIHPKESLDYVIGEFMAQARGEKIMAENIPVLRKDKSVFYADIITTCIFIDGQMCNVGFFSDITERKKAEDILKRFNQELEEKVKTRTEELDVSLKEKEGLLKEIHHRVRNNLQVVSGIINLQAKSVSDPASLKQIQEIRMRIGTLALVHEIAYLAKTPESINMRDFLHRCTSRVIDEFGCEPGRIDITITAENVQVALNQAVPCSLIVNELLMNSIRHAFPGKRHGEIRIGFSIANGNYVLEYSDDGVGFPEGMHPQQAETGGLSLIQGLAKQIRGRVESRTRPGTQYTLTFPAEIREEVNVWQK